MVKGDDRPLTEREISTLGLAWQCMDTQPKINYTKLAELAGYTEGSCRVAFGLIKAKLAKLSAADGTQKPSNAIAKPKVSTANGKTARSGKTSAQNKHPASDTELEDAPIAKKPKAARKTNTATKKGGRSKTPAAKKEDPVEEDGEAPLSGPEDYGYDGEILDNVNGIKQELFDEGEI